MTIATFETAAIADAIKKAERVAPSHGQAFDKAAGILLEIDPVQKICIVKATNLDVFMMEWVDIESCSGAAAWRLPSKLLAQTFTSLPIGTGRTVTLEQKGNTVHLSTGRTRAQFYLMDAGYYPGWTAFDPDLVTPVMDIGGRINQIEWSADKSSEPINGINFDGQYITATDRYRIARVPLELPAAKAESITVPAGLLGSLLKQTGEVSIGFSKNHMLIMPDEHSQIRTVLYGIPYPSLDRALGYEHTHSFKARKAQLLEVINRASNFSGGDRFPVLRCYLGKEEFAVMMRNEEIGLLGDVVELPTQLQHERITIYLTPKNIVDPLEHAPSEEVEIFYNLDKPFSPLKIDGGSGYIALVMPRRESEPGTSS